MISCNLQGGLGNQMFQIAATNALALRNNDKAVFNLSACHTPLQGHPSNKYKETIFANIPDTTDFKGRVVYNEPSFSYSELPYAPEMVLNGYFQSEKYFSDFKEETKALFNLPYDVNDEVHAFRFIFSLTPKPITSVHVRRGDYLKNPSFHPVCSIEYYKKAMELIGDNYFVFISDDMKWVKENFKGENIYYSPFTNELSDLKFMKFSHNIIISNSSFSWWGAYLNDTTWIPNKKVIAPKLWFGPNGPQDTQDLLPSDWIILE